MNKNRFFEIEQELFQFRRPYKLFEKEKQSPTKIQEHQLANSQTWSGQMGIIDEIKKLFTSGKLPDELAGQSIGPDALEIGDIILSTTKALESIAIRVGTGSEVSHAMICISKSDVAEVVASGVRTPTIMQALGPAKLAVAFRHPAGVSRKQAETLYNFVTENKGKKYDYEGAGKAGILRFGIVNNPLFPISPGTIEKWIQDEKWRAKLRKWRGIVSFDPSKKNRFICSEFVLVAFEKMGLPLTIGSPSWQTPADIVDLAFQAHKLGYVGHLKA